MMQGKKNIEAKVEENIMMTSSDNILTSKCEAITFTTASTTKKQKTRETPSPPAKPLLRKGTAALRVLRTSNLLENNTPAASLSTSTSTLAISLSLGAQIRQKPFNFSEEISLLQLPQQDLSSSPGVSGDRHTRQQVEEYYGAKESKRILYHNVVKQLKDTTRGVTGGELIATRETTLLNTPNRPRCPQQTISAGHHLSQLNAHQITLEAQTTTAAAESPIKQSNYRVESLNRKLYSMLQFQRQTSPNMRNGQPNQPVNILQLYSVEQPCRASSSCSSSCCYSPSTTNTTPWNPMKGSSFQSTSQREERQIYQSKQQRNSFNFGQIRSRLCLEPRIYCTRDKTTQADSSYGTRDALIPSTPSIHQRRKLTIRLRSASLASGSMKDVPAVSRDASNTKIDESFLSVTRCSVTQLELDKYVKKVPTSTSLIKHTSQWEKPPAQLLLEGQSLGNHQSRSSSVAGYNVGAAAQAVTLTPESKPSFQRRTPVCQQSTNRKRAATASESKRSSQISRTMSGIQDVRRAAVAVAAANTTDDNDDGFMLADNVSAWETWTDQEDNAIKQYISQNANAEIE